MPWTVTWGLFLAWAVHDVEELATGSEFMRHTDLPLPKLDQEHMSTAIGLMGGVMAAASAAGAASGGRSPFFQTVLLGFGLHSITHVAPAIVLRRYTPGVATVPLVVAPFSLWAIGQLRARGVEFRARPRSFLWFPVVVGGAHVAASLITRLRHRGQKALRSTAPRSEAGGAQAVPVGADQR